MDNQESERSKRGIESIAHLFLSQLGNEINQCNRKEEPAAEPKPAEIMPGNEICKNNVPDPEKVMLPGDLESSLAGEIVLAYHLRDPFSKVCQYARYKSQYDEKVSLFSIDQYEVTMALNFDDELVENGEVLAETEVNASELIPLINSESSDSDLILLNVDPSFAVRVKEIISHADCITIITDCTNESIVNSYKVLKSVNEFILEDQEIQLFICDAPNEDYADRAFYKFDETSRKFIDKVVIPAGCTVVEDIPTKPMDDSGIDKNEILALDEVESLIEDKEPESDISESDEFVGLEEAAEIQEAAVEEDTDISEPIIIETVQQYDLPDSQWYSSEMRYYENVCSFRDEDMSESCESASDEADPDKNDRAAYKPLCSEESDECMVSKDDVKKPLVINNESTSGQYRLNVVSKPKMLSSYTGPSTLKPVELRYMLDDDSSVCSFVSLNFGRLTGLYGAVPVEHRPFIEMFPNSYIMIRPSGVPTIFISVVFEVSAVEIIEDICSWCSENMGVLAARYRNLKIRPDAAPELVVIAGRNHNDIFDEAMLAADEYDSVCRVWQLVQMNINNKTFVSLY